MNLYILDFVKNVLKTFRTFTVSILILLWRLKIYFGVFLDILIY